MPSRSKNERNWIILQGEYTAHNALTYIGRIVTDPARPGNDFVPDIDRKTVSSDELTARRLQQLEEVKPFMLHTVVGKTSEEGILATVEGTVSGRLKIPAIIGGGGKKVEEDEWAMKSERTRTLGLEQHVEVLQTVQTKFKETIEAFIEKHGHERSYYLMVGLKIALNPQYDNKAFASKSVDTQGTIPVAQTTTAATGLPMPSSANPEASMEYTQTATSAVNESVKGEVAFAAEYIELEIDQGGVLRLFRKKEIKKKLRSKGLKNFRGEALAFGSGSEDEDDEDEDDDDEDEKD